MNRQEIWAFHLETNIQEAAETMNNFKCKLCKTCDGRACIGQMPGMGGPLENKNFILNCQAWKNYYQQEDYRQNTKVFLGPMTGAVENVGYPDEKQFYSDLFSAVAKTRIKISLGDGTPNTKLQYGLEALSATGKKAAVFFKPYPDQKIYERIEWAQNQAEYLGMDTDAYNIITMRNLVHLERKTGSQLKELKKYINGLGLPFVIKGIFTQWDLDVVEELHPDAVVVSNHGGRIETETGSTADYLKNHIDYLKKYCGEVWVDGGIRSRDDINAAAFLGAAAVMVGRPAVTALCRSGEEGIRLLAEKLGL